MTQSDEQQFYEPVLALLERATNILVARLEPPKMTTFARTAHGFRFTDRGAPQAIVQKMARVVSGLRAALVLLTEGYIQEQAALCRSVDEANDDISFLGFGMIFDQTELHTQFLEEFFMEEFEDAARPHETRTKRPSIKRSKIHAYLSRVPGSGPDTSSSQAAMQAVYKTNSGFVHGASPHLMELYGGARPHFHMRGMRGTHFWSDHAADYRNYVYRSLMAFAMAARAFDDDTLFSELYAYGKRFASTEPA